MAEESSDGKKCEYCKKNLVVYKLILDQNVKCPFCKCIKYKKNEHTFSICDENCKGLYWSVSFPPVRNNKNNDPKINTPHAIVMMEKDECNNCGRIDFPDVSYRYEIVGEIHKNTKNNKVPLERALREGVPVKRALREEVPKKNN
jgi:hypothetical protein